MRDMAGLVAAGFLLAIPGASGLAGASAEKAVLWEDSAAAVWWAHPCAKVFPDDAPPAERSAAAPLAAARGETEAVQIVLRPKRAVSGVAAKVSDFQGPGRLRGSIATVRWVAYVRVRQASGPHGGTGLYPDPLPPRAPAQIAAGQNQAAWVTIRVPPDAKPGDYRAEVALTANGAEIGRAPLALHVWNFTLPATKLKVLAAARASTLPERGPGAAREETYRRYVANMADHGVNAMTATVLQPGQGWQRHDDDVAFLRSVGVRHFPMYLGWVAHERHLWPANAQWDLRQPLAAMGALARTSPRSVPIADASGTDFDPAFRRTLVDLASQFTRHYQELGILDQSFVRFVDEPDVRDERTLNWTAKMSKLIKEASPALRIFHTTAPVPALTPCTDVWEINAELWEPYGAGREQARRTGAEIWVYHNSIPLIDYTLMRVRTFAWALWRHRVSGTGAWWDLTAWTLSRKNPWEDPLYGPWNGGGVLLYPPRDEREQGPIDSIRWEVWRDSLEDYRLLEGAAALAKREPENMELKRLLAEADAVCPTWPGVRDLAAEPYWTDPRKLERLRCKIAEAVEQASGK